MRYHLTFEYAQRAVALSPENDRYLASGTPAEILDEHRLDLEYKEKAPEIALKMYGEDHPSVARDRNNLGNAWKSFGDYAKAIDYFEPSLSVLKVKLGENHPNTKIVENNLKQARE